MTTRIKICGITRLEDARYASAVGADHIGFVHKPGNPRHADAATAREIIKWVIGPTPVGVFKDEAAEHISAICSSVGFAMVQLDGHEDPDVCSAIQAGGIPVIKTIRAVDCSSSEQLLSMARSYKRAADFIRVDVTETDMMRGNGWREQLIRELTTEFEVFLSGAFTPQNIEHHVETVQPYAVDISASVEESPGLKDFDKLGALFDAWNSLKADVA